MGKNEFDLEELKHENRMRELKYLRNTELLLLEKQYEINMRGERQFQVLPPVPPAPNYRGTSITDSYTEEDDEEEENKEVRSGKKYGKK